MTRPPLPRQTFRVKSSDGVQLCVNTWPRVATGVDRTTSSKGPAVAAVAAEDAELKSESGGRGSEPAATNVRAEGSGGSGSGSGEDGGTRREADGVQSDFDLPVVVLVHPYTVMGGCQALMKGMAKALNKLGFDCLTVDLRGAGASSGHASLTGAREVDDVTAVCRFAVEDMQCRRILMLGSSAGAPIAGSACQRVPEVVGYIGIGYVFGVAASILFGGHYANILEWQGPKLFIQGSQDGFTTTRQLEAKLKNAKGVAVSHFFDGIGHFELEGPYYDSEVAALVLEFVAQQLH